MALECSTPLNKNLQISETSVRRVSFSTKSPFVELERSDDAKERKQRRSEALLQKCISNIPQQGRRLDDSISASDEDMNQHFQICLKLFAENKINAKNAWSLKIIDYLPKITDSLQNAGTSLDVSAKVYGIRIDDVHTEVMKLANMMTQIGNNPTEEENDADEDDGNKENEIPKKKKKVRQIKFGQKYTIAKDVKALLQPVSMLSAQYFQNNNVLKLSAIDNLFTSRFPLDRSGYRLLFHERENAWPVCKDCDEIVKTETPSTILPFEVPLPTDFKLRLAIPDFDVIKWDPDEEDKLLNATQDSISVEKDVLVFDEQGFPIAELDGSVRDNFEEPPMNDEPLENHEVLEEEEFTAHAQGNIPYVVDFKQQNGVRGSEYSYNSLISTQSGKVIEQVWAGPSHWKLKFIKPATARFTGQIDKQTGQRQRRKEKIQEQMLDFAEALDIDFSKQVKSNKKKINNLESSKITLPLPDIIDYHTADDRIPLILKPKVITSQKKDSIEEAECEVGPYNYENLNDSQYCSQNNIPDDNDENHDEDDDINDLNDNPDDCPIDFVGDNLIQQPEMVTKDYIQYAHFAKKMDMKKLKNAVWKCIAEDNDKTLSKNSNKNEPHVNQTMFSTVYKRLPDKINEKMKSELSCPLAFAALLHLANEHNLELKGQMDLKDIQISSAECPE